MVYVYGSRLYGKVDEVPGLGHVATKFAHLDYFPLFPTEGWLVISQSGNGWRGVRIPMSFKSVAMGWGRAIAIIAGCVGAVLAVIAFGGNVSRSGPEVVPSLGITIGAWGFLAFSKLYKGITRASYARACELGRLAGLSEAGMNAIAQAYGQPPMAYGFEPLPAQPNAMNVDQQPLPAIPVANVASSEAVTRA